MLKALGLVGAGALIPFRNASASLPQPPHVPAAPSCFLTPYQTPGPFYFNANLFRQDITEGRPGVPLSMEVTVVDANCDPIPGALVDLWHCDKDGVYSGYTGQGHDGSVNTVGETFMRGVQTTDGSGKATFLSIYPGWYPGRLAHVHFKVHLNNSTFVTSQFYFPDSTSAAVDASPLYVNGPNGTTVGSDPVLQGSSSTYNQLLMAVTGDVANGYAASHCVGINTVFTGLEAPVEASVFSWEPAFPNPVRTATTVRLTLAEAGVARLLVHAVDGSVVAVVFEGHLGAGLHALAWDRGGLAEGTYLLSLELKHAGGISQASQTLLLR